MYYNENMLFLDVVPEFRSHAVRWMGGWVVQRISICKLDKTKCVHRDEQQSDAVERSVFQLKTGQEPASGNAYNAYASLINQYE